MLYQFTYNQLLLKSGPFLRLIFIAAWLLPNQLSAQVRHDMASSFHLDQLPAQAVLRLFPRIVAVDPAVAFTIPCLPPVGFWEGNRVSSGYGWRKHPIHGRQAHHTGIDIAGTYQYIRAAATGTVTQAGYNKRLGYYVRIDHLNSYQTLYGHLARVMVSRGEAVSIGDKIGVLGRSGAATGLHLHYAVLKNGGYEDPAPYLTLAVRVVDWYQQQPKPSVRH